MELLAAVSIVGHQGGLSLAAEGGPLFQINLFQVIVAALNFVVFLVLMWVFAFKPISTMLSSRRERIEQGLKDAEQARADRENAEKERLAVQFKVETSELPEEERKQLMQLLEQHLLPVPADLNQLLLAQLAR